MPLAASFRDPAGYCFPFAGKILRAVSPSSLDEFESFLQSASAQKSVEAGQLIPTRKIPQPELNQYLANPDLAQKLDPNNVGALFEHERIDFPSYPYEWSPEMLFAAGELTLDLAAQALQHGFGLKDATPYNVLFRGAQPIFIDVLSFERRNPADPLWKPYAQFVRTFILPLLANRYFGMRIADIFLTRRDGLEPEELYHLCGFWRKFFPPWLALVTLPTWLSGKGENPDLYKTQTLDNPEKAQFILQSLFARTRRNFSKLAPSQQKSTAWSGYMETKSYSAENFQAKETFVQDFLKEAHPARLLDIGANTGHFSLLAANAGAKVVAIDYDPACMGRLWTQAREKNLSILPLVVDLARPTPGIGWRNQECPPFLQRAAGAFDSVIMLAVLHHLIVTERIPLGQILDLAASLTTRWLLLEYVGPGDEMFQRIARGRESLYTGFNKQTLQAAAAKHFDLIRALDLPKTDRSLLLFRKRS
jgi:hypothetical protein